MLNEPSILDTVIQNKDTLLKSVTVSCVIICFHDNKLKVLLNKQKNGNECILPVGFVDQDEDIDDAVLRILKANTNLDRIYIKQFYLFGKCKRYSNIESRKLLSLLNVACDNEHWYLKRSVSVGYYALVKYDKISLIDDKFVEMTWFDVNNIPDLYGDHNDIVKKAFDSIRFHLGYIPLGFELLPEKFTMPDLRTLYEIVVGHELDRRNFQRKMLSNGLIIKSDEKKKKGAHKSPFLYSFNKEKYIECSLEGMQLMPWNIQ